MNKQLTLAGKLTIGLVGVMVPAGLLFLFLFFQFFNPEMEEKLFDVVERGTIASGKVAAESISFEVKIASEDENTREALQETIKGKLKEASETTVALLVFDAEGKVLVKAQRDENAVFTDTYEPVLEEVRKKAKDASRNADKFEKMRNEGAFEASVIKGDNVMAVVIIAAETAADGYLVFVESIAEYRDSQSTMSALMSVSLMLILLAIAVGVTFLARRAVKPIERIAMTAQKIAEGDLTYQQEETHSVAETVRLNSAVREMANAISLQVNSIKGLTADATSVSRDVAEAMGHLAKSASQQASAVSETAATVVQLEKTGKSAASNARQIVEASEKTTEASIRGQEAVNTTNEIISQIKEDSQQISLRAKALLSAVEEIGDVINSVNAISEQSKILAVNASIEAAKAGEYGAGFAVVAQEVKDLAQQSKEATLEITGTLTSIRNAIEGMVDLARNGENRTEEGVTTVGNTGAIVNDLSEAIRENSEVADRINTSVAQQTIGLSQIATSIEQISVSATANQQISEKTETSTRQMRESLQELSAMVAKWRTGDDS